jgi:hypothetical protein
MKQIIKILLFGFTFLIGMWCGSAVYEIRHPEQPAEHLKTFYVIDKVETSWGWWNLYLIDSESLDTVVVSVDCPKALQYEQLYLDVR